MGLGNVFLNDLIELKQKGALDGATRVMEIGAQQISDSLMIAPGLAEAYQLFGCTSPPAPRISPSRRRHRRRSGRRSDLRASPSTSMAMPSGSISTAARFRGGCAAPSTWW